MSRIVIVLIFALLTGGFVNVFVVKNVKVLVLVFTIPFGNWKTAWNPVAVVVFNSAALPPASVDTP